MTPILSVQNVSFTFRDGTQALKHVSLDILNHEIFVLFGPARSGKTVLLRVFNRLSDLGESGHLDGKILFNGQDVFDRSVNITDLRRRIGMVFAVPTPLPGSIRDNVLYGLKMAGMRDRVEMERRLEHSLTLAALWDEVKDRLNQSAFALSGGQKQRLCIARSLALEPEVLLLDNPTSGLDPLSTGMVEDTLNDLKRRYTIVMVPHSVQQAARIATRAAFLLDGELVDLGDTGHIFINPSNQRTEDYVTGRFG